MGGPLRCSEADLAKDLTGQTMIVTGATCGIGLAVARQLVKQGASVVMAGRNVPKLEECASEIVAEMKATQGQKFVDPAVLKLDLSSMDSVAEAARDFKCRFGQIDVLLNNAGVMNAPKTVTSNGFELQIATNHLGPFLFTELLMDRIKEGGRVVNTSSCASNVIHLKNPTEVLIDFDDLHSERKEYDGWVAYGQSKLANVLHSMELAKRYGQTKQITSVSLHPGFVDSELIRHSLHWILRPFVLPILGYCWQMVDVVTGAQTSLHCCLNEDVAKHNGAFFSQAHTPKNMYHERPDLQSGGWPMPHPSRHATPENAARLWEVSEAQLAKWLA